MPPLRLPLRLAARVGRTHSRLVRQSIVLSPFSRLSLQISRSYASPGRPKKAASDSEEPKRSTKSDASKPETKPKTKPKTTTAAPKKTKPKTTKAAPKKPAKKPIKKAKKPVKKVVKKSPEELQVAKDRAIIKAQKLQLKTLKEAALSPPRSFKARTFIIFHGDRAKGISRTNGPSFAELVRESADAYGKLSSQELEHWNHVTNQRNLEVERVYKDFIESHTPDQIRLANNARRRLRQLCPQQARKFGPLKDDRLVKRPTTAYIQFSAERQRSGDFRGVSLGQTVKDISAEWKALSSSEKKTYYDLAAKDVERYKSEHFEAYGHEAPATYLSDTD